MPSPTPMLLVPAALFLAGLAYSSLWIDHGVNPLDTGFIATASARVARGEVPYRDFFTMVTPGSFYLNGVVLMATGPSLAALNRVGAVVLSLVGLATFALTVRVTGSRPWGLAAWLAATVLGVNLVGPVPNYSWPALLAALTFWTVLLGPLQRTGPPGPQRACVMAGAILGGCFLFKQTLGVYFAASAAAWFLVLRARSVDPLPARHALALALSFAATLAALAALLAAQGALADAVRDTFVLPLTRFRGEASRPVPALADALGNFQTALFYAGLAAVGAALVLAGQDLARRRPESPVSLGLALAAAAGFLPCFERFHLEKLCMAQLFVVVLLAYWTVRWDRRGGGRTLAGRLVLAATVAGCLVAASRTARFFSGRWVELATGAGTIRVRPDQAPRTEAILAWLRRIPPGEKVLVVPMSPIYYFLDRRESPTPWDLVIPANFTPGDLDRLVRFVRAGSVRSVIVDEFWTFDGRRFADYAGPLVDEIRSSYRIQERFDDRTALWVRR